MNVKIKIPKSKKWKEKKDKFRRKKNILTKFEK